MPHFTIQHQQTYANNFPAIADMGEQENWLPRVKTWFHLTFRSLRNWKKLTI